jgi:hypothetical protein
MRRLLKNLVYLATPVMLVIALPWVILVGSGELVPVRLVEYWQRTRASTVLYGPAFSNLTAALKLRGVLDRRPKVITLGTSRVMQFRAEMFAEPERFYNAGGGVSQIQEFASFARKLPNGYTPELIVIGLDQNFFNPNWRDVDNADIETRLAETGPDGMAVFTQRWRDIYTDWWRGRYTLRAILRHDSKGMFLGLNAVVNHNGLRNDGSYYYGGDIRSPNDPTAEDFQFKNTFQRIAEGNGRFEYSATLSAQAIRELDAFLDWCETHRIHVVGFLPPFAHAVVEKLAAMHSQYEYLDQISPAVTPLFHRRGFSMFDFSDLAALGATDRETTDGFHASEKAYLRMLLQMAHADDRLRDYVAPQLDLQRRLDSTPGDYDVFDDF